MAQMRLTQSSYANEVYSSAYEADLENICSVFIDFVYELQHLRWPFFHMQAGDVCFLLL
jgi:hypothetical protein